MVDHNNYFKGRSQVRLEKTTVAHTLDWYRNFILYIELNLFITGSEFVSLFLTSLKEVFHFKKMIIISYFMLGECLHGYAHFVPNFQETIAARSISLSKIKKGVASDAKGGGVNN